MAGNKPISDNTAFPFETNVRAIAGIAGFKTGTPNTNTKIGGRVAQMLAEYLYILLVDQEKNYQLI